MRVTSYSVELNKKLNVLVKEKAINYKTIKLDNPDVIVELFNTLFHLNVKAEEHMYLLAMDTKCNPIGVFLVSKGTVDMTLVHPREIFVRLLLCGASSFVMVHNHPSGDETSSKEDLRLTKRVKDCAEMMGINFLDHIIVGESYYSFKSEGKL